MCVLNTFKTLQAKAELRKLQFEKAIYVYLRGIKIMSFSNKIALLI